MKIETLVTVAVTLAAAYAFLRWFLTGPRTPDPWGPEIDKDVGDEASVPLCPHCLSPQEHNGWFCPHCASTFGPYVNYLPFTWIFTLGEALRAEIRPGTWPKALLLTGHVLVALSLLSALAPIYFILLILRLGGWGARLIPFPDRTR